MYRFLTLAIGTVLGLALVTSTPSSAQADLPYYAALGDSVAAGAGLPAADAASTDDTACDRSAFAYPYYLATMVPAQVANLACSGAKVDEGVYDTQTRNGTTFDAQLDRAFTYGTPDIVTVTIGANDARWTQSIRDCYFGGCGSTFDKARAKVYRADLRVELYWMLEQIYQRSGDTVPRVFLSGYYLPFPSGGCAYDLAAITPEEQDWLVTQTNELNQAIQSVVPYFSFANYVPLDFAGHDLCAENSWIQGQHDEAPFHPTIEGQQAIAQAFATALDP